MKTVAPSLDDVDSVNVFFFFLYFVQFDFLSDAVPFWSKENSIMFSITLDIFFVLGSKTSHAHICFFYEWERETERKNKKHSN